MLGISEATKSKTTFGKENQHFIKKLEQINESKLNVEELAKKLDALEKNVEKGEINFGEAIRELNEHKKNIEKLPNNLKEKINHLTNSLNDFMITSTKANICIIGMKESIKIDTEKDELLIKQERIEDKLKVIDKEKYELDEQINELDERICYFDGIRSNLDEEIKELKHNRDKCWRKMEKCKGISKENDETKIHKIKKYYKVKEIERNNYCKKITELEEELHDKECETNKLLEKFWSKEISKSLLSKEYEQLEEEKKICIEVYNEKDKEINEINKCMEEYQKELEEMEEDGCDNKQIQKQLKEMFNKDKKLENLRKRIDINSEKIEIFELLEMKKEFDNISDGTVDSKLVDELKEKFEKQFNNKMIQFIKEIGENYISILDTMNIRKSLEIEVKLKMIYENLSQNDKQIIDKNGINNIIKKIHDSKNKQKNDELYNEILNSGQEEIDIEYIENDISKYENNMIKKQFEIELSDLNKEINKINSNKENIMHLYNKKNKLYNELKIRNLDDDIYESFSSLELNLNEKYMKYYSEIEKVIEKINNECMEVFEEENWKLLDENEKIEQLKKLRDCTLGDEKQYFKELPEIVIKENLNELLEELKNDGGRENFEGEEIHGFYSGMQNKIFITKEYFKEADIMMEEIVHESRHFYSLEQLNKTFEELTDIEKEVLKKIYFPSNAKEHSDYIRDMDEIDSEIAGQKAQFEVISRNLSNLTQELKKIDNGKIGENRISELNEGLNKSKEKIEQFDKRLYLDDLVIKIDSEILDEKYEKIEKSIEKLKEHKENIEEDKKNLASFIESKKGKNNYL